MLDEPVDEAELAKQRQVMDNYLFRHVGIRDFDWSLYLASKKYYESDPIFTSVFPGIIKRGIRRCLN